MVKSVDQVVREVSLLLEPILDEMAFELVDIEFISDRGRWILRIYLDKAGGITLDDCARVSRELGDLIEVKDVLKDGESLSSALGKRGIFSTLVEDIIAIGEEGGKLDESLIKIGDIYEKRLDYTLKVATQLIEPILILIVGFAIGLIVIGMLLPLFRLNMLIK